MGKFQARFYRGGSGSPDKDSVSNRKTATAVETSVVASHSTLIVLLNQGKSFPWRPCGGKEKPRGGAWLWARWGETWQRPRALNPCQRNAGGD